MATSYTHLTQLQLFETLCISLYSWLVIKIDTAHQRMAFADAVISPLLPGQQVVALRSPGSDGHFGCACNYRVL